MTESAPKYLVLLIDMGGPRNLSEVKPYLRRIFSDPSIIPGNPVKRWLLSRLIAAKAAPETRKRYAAIGGRSIAVDNMRALAKQLTDYFAKRDIQIECQVSTRYSFPNILQGLSALSRNGDQPVTPVYLYPHKTTALTGSCENVLTREAGKLGVAVETGVQHLGSTNAYIQGWAETINEAVKRPEDTFVLLSAHSLPMSIINRGDTYVTEFEQSAGRIQSRLGGLNCGLAYQSQEGKNWLGPTVEEKALEAFEKGYRDLIVAPLSFICDSTETLLDLDKDLRHAIEPPGFTSFVRLETPDKRGFLSKMVVEALCKEWELEP